MKFPSPTHLLYNVHIPLEEKEDVYIWSPVDDGVLAIKVAYRYKRPAAQILSWGKLIWNVHIPTFISLLFWRLIHQQIPTYENLDARGMIVPSMCSLCLTHPEEL